METTTTSQNEKILAYLKDGYTVTPLEALSKFGSLRLGARIFQLRKMGHNISTAIVATKSGKHVAQYKLTKK